ncbi:hypothetical protein ACTXIX_14810 [Glutamicibacter ardleyensis]|uniref:hypothetical protein n=1 Tax=Glutamicibacter ardleyensis TaxID=225894 RepID=UPI003FD23DCD
MNQTTSPLANQTPALALQNASRDWSSQRFLDNQTWQVEREQEWEANPHSWMKPSECPWNETLAERFEREYTNVPTQLDAMVTVLYPEMNEEFMETMIQNLMFKKGMADPNFPNLFEMSEYQQATMSQKKNSNEKMDLIAKEVISFLTEKKTRYSTSENPVFPSLVAKMK